MKRVQIIARLFALPLFALCGVAWSQVCPPSPLVVDVAGDGLELGPKGVGTHFDVDADGVIDHVQWLRSGGDEAFLVADLDGNNSIHDGSELFGQGTDLILENCKAGNGFIALAQHDKIELGGNDDGLITKEDAIWPMLRLWTDKNADGIAQRWELRRPLAAGLVAFETIPKTRIYYDEAGNFIPFYASAITIQGRKKAMVDVFFARLP